ncbi:hypothetical protein GCM10009678_66870 [Actinomadura kijaniata]|uniref:AMP-binding protein n=1 Tax=Actinomadura kijaniata TaxID=46161 RepID=UPI002FEA44EA
MLLGDLAHRGATLWPDRTAFAWDGRGRTYRELHERVLRWRRLLAGGGVRHGDRIALLTVNAPEAIEAAFAASLLGAVVVPLNVRLAPDEIRFQVADAAARHAIVHPTLADLARAGGLTELTCWTPGPGLERDLAAAPGTDAPRPAPDAPVIQLYTSGTTGRPKGCLLTNRGWAAATANAVQAFGLTGDDVLLGALPLFHVAGYGAALGHLAVGGTVVLPPIRRPGRCGRWWPSTAPPSRSSRPAPAARCAWSSAWPAPNAPPPCAPCATSASTTGASTGPPRRATSSPSPPWPTSWSAPARSGPSCCRSTWPTTARTAPARSASCCAAPA